MIAQALERAAADWARHGLEIARFVTVDDNAPGLLVKLVPAAEMPRPKGDSGGKIPLADTVASKDGKWLHMLLDDRLVHFPDELFHVLEHEIIHALIPKAPHLEGVGIFSRARSSASITRADIDHLARFTTVGPSEVPFDEE